MVEEKSGTGGRGFAGCLSKQTPLPRTKTRRVWGEQSGVASAPFAGPVCPSGSGAASPGGLPRSERHGSRLPGFFAFVFLVLCCFVLFFFFLRENIIYLASHSPVSWVDVKTEFLDCSSYSGFMSKSLAAEFGL